MTVALFAVTVLYADAVRAQGAAETTITLRPVVGLNLPLAEQRDLFRDARMLGVQLAVGGFPNVQLTASATWAFADVRFDAAHDRVDIAQIDAGVEYGRSNSAGHYWQFRPFVGAGAGMRHYYYEDPVLDDSGCFAGYASTGTDLRIERFGLRLEGRAAVYCHKPPEGGESRTRADAVILLGISYQIR
jgi:hypothetical protein